MSPTRTVSHGQINFRPYRRLQRVLTEFPLWEGLEESCQGLLARVENFGWLSQIDGSHIEGTERVIVKEVFYVSTSQLQWRCGIVAEDDHV